MAKTSPHYGTAGDGSLLVFWSCLHLFYNDEKGIRKRGEKYKNKNQGLIYPFITEKEVCQIVYKQTGIRNLGPAHVERWHMIFIKRESKRVKEQFNKKKKMLMGGYPLICIQLVGSLFFSYGPHFMMCKIYLDWKPNQSIP